MDEFFKKREIDNMIDLLHNTYIYIGLELLAIGILLRFVIPWSREFKQWKAEQAEEAGKQRDNDLLNKLRNEKRRDRE